MPTLTSSLVHNTLIITFLMATCLPASRALADNSSESEWLYSLKHAHLDNGGSLPIHHGDSEETIRINNLDLKKLFARTEADTDNHFSRLQFSPLNYQADINEKEIQLKLYYQF